MKKIFRTIMALALSTVVFTACEDVPEPYDIPGTGTNVPGAVTIEGGEGDGTVGNPFNAISALNLGKQLNPGDITPDYYYIKGKVVSIATDKNTGAALNYDQGTYGNATFYISADGTKTNQFYVYRALYLGNKKYSTTSGDPILQVGDDVVVCAKITNYNGTIETSQGDTFLYSLNGVNRGGEPASSQTTGEATGDGTLANPFNSVAAIKKCQEVGENESEDVYIKGKVVSIDEQYGTQYGNATFYISDDGTSANQFQVWRALYLGNKKYTSGTLLKEGDEVIVYGKVTNFKGNKPETVQNKAYLYSLNGVTEGGSDNPQPTETLGTAEAPITVAKALELINALEDRGESAADAYVKGTVVSVASFNDQYKSLTYYISDDGTATNQLQVYSGKGLGGADFTGTSDLKAGDIVVVKGKLKKYINKDNSVNPEINLNNELVSLNGQGGGSGEQQQPTGETAGTVDGNTITVAANDFGFTAANTDLNGKTLTLTDGTTLTFAAGENKTTPKHYASNSAIRIYPKNSVTITAKKKIASIVVTCAKSNGTLCNASGDLNANPGTITLGDVTVNVTDVNANSTVITNTSGATGTPSQFHIESLVITYAE